MGQKSRTRIKPHDLLSDPEKKTLLGLHASKHYKTICNHNNLSSCGDYVNVGSRLESLQYEEVVFERRGQWLYGK
jgi:hypothetical protein